MVDFAELNARRETFKQFTQTSLGQAFLRFDQALAKAWQVDTEAGWRDNISDKKLTEVWDREKEARKALLEILYPLAGITNAQPKP